MYDVGRHRESFQERALDSGNAAKVLTGEEEFVHWEKYRVDTPYQQCLFAQNRNFNASCPTRGLTDVLLMTPKVGELKFVSGFAN